MLVILIPLWSLHILVFPILCIVDTYSNYFYNFFLEVKKVAILPRMARHIKVETNVTFNNTIDTPSIAFVLKNRKKKGYAVTIPNTALHSKIVEGTNFFYRKIGNNHNIWGTGPILSEMVIMVRGN